MHIDEEEAEADDDIDEVLFLRDWVRVEPVVGNGELLFKNRSNTPFCGMSCTLCVLVNQ